MQQTVKFPNIHPNILLSTQALGEPNLKSKLLRRENQTLGASNTLDVGLRHPRNPSSYHISTSETPLKKHLWLTLDRL